VRIGDLAQDRTRMTPFAVQQVWRAGHPVPVTEKGSTLALLFEATVRRITAAATSPSGCPCCRCSTPIRRAADLQSVTVAVARSDVEEFRAIVRVYRARCAPDPDTAETTAGCEHRAIALRFRVCAPPSTAWKPTRKHPASAAIC
jgi:CelD/BcsL family acetyltransferase involved in cellulose biosynthesis